MAPKKGTGKKSKHYKAEDVRIIIFHTPHEGDSDDPDWDSEDEGGLGQFTESASDSAGDSDQSDSASDDGCRPTLVLKHCL